MATLIRPEVRAFLADIKENADDDVPRLILADWLMDQGDEARGEFITLQCRLARISQHDPQWAPCKAREEELVHHHGRDWIGPLRALQGEYRFRRGLLVIEIDIAWLLKAEEEAMDWADSWAWVERVLLRCDGQALERLNGAEVLRQFTSLDLSAQRVGPNGAAALAAIAPQLDSLLELHLWRSAIGDAGVRSLMTALPPRLQILDLSMNGIGDGGMMLLAASPLLAQLDSLDLRSNPISARGTAALAQSQHLSRLSVLNLTSTYLSAAGARALATSPQLSRLTRLTLARTDLGPEGARALSTSPYLAGLTDLDLGACAIGVDGARALASSAHLGRLTRLNLEVNHIGNDGAAALAASAPLARLRELNLRSNRIGAAGGHALAESPYLGQLRSLRLWGNDVGHEAATALRQRFGERLIL